MGLFSAQRRRWHGGLRARRVPHSAPRPLELLKKAPAYSGEIQKELYADSAAIVSALASRFSHSRHED